MTLNANVITAEARRLAQVLANFCKAYAYLLPLEIPFPGLRLKVTVEKIVSKQDTQPLRYDEDEQRAD